eukprot:m.29415 g.29415  ORF g.29415 m.29415 type:complete len:115 (-) comp14342_c0_seq2:11-355(-)
MAAELEHKVQTFIESLRQVAVLVCGLDEAAQPLLIAKMNSLVEEMRSIDEDKDKVNDVFVPMELLDYVDQGKNPDLFSKDCLAKVLKQHQSAQGKIETFQVWQRCWEGRREIDR